MQPADRGTLMSHQLFLALLAPPVQKEGETMCMKKQESLTMAYQRSETLRIHQLSCQQNLGNMWKYKQKKACI